MINFVVCDLENALIPNGMKEVPEDTIELISELKKNGVNFAVATGRNYDAVRPLFGKVKNDIMYICNDGGVIIYQDRVISKTPIDRLVCLDVASEMEKEHRFKLIYSGERNAVVNTHDMDFVNHLKALGIETEYVKDVKLK